MIVFVEMETAPFILMIVGIVLAVAVGTFFLTRWLFKRELAKNPPINEKMIRAMYRSMGRTPTEAQIRAIMKNVNSAK